MSTFIRLKELTRSQWAVAFFLWLTFNVVRILERIRMPFGGDELYQVHRLRVISSLDQLLGAVQGEPGQLVPGHWFFMWPWVHAIPQDNKYLLAIPHWIVMNIFFFLFIKTDWRRLLAPALDDVKTFSLIWLNFLAIFFMTCNRTHIYYSMEIRVYAILSLLALLTLHLTVRIWEGPFRLSNVAGLFLVLFSHIYGTIMLTSSLLYVGLARLEWTKRGVENTLRRIARTLVPTFLLAVLLILPFWIYLSKGSIPTPGTSWRDTHLSIERGMSGVKQVYKFYYHNKPIQHTSHFFLIVGWLLFLRKRRKLLLFAVVMVILPTVVIYLLDLWGRYWFLQKQFIWVITFWSFFLAACYGETVSFMGRFLARHTFLRRVAGFREFAD